MQHVLCTLDWSCHRHVYADGRPASKNLWITLARSKCSYDAASFMTCGICSSQIRRTPLCLRNCPQDSLPYKVHTENKT